MTTAKQLTQPDAALRLIEEGAASMELTRASMPPAQNAVSSRETFDVIVIGGGQAGLSVGYHLARAGVRFVILDANERIGDSWRKRWDSLRLFTPAKFDGLAGMRFPAPRNSFPTKDEMASYLEQYAARFQLPVRSGVRVEKLFKRGAGYVVKAGALELEAAAGGRGHGQLSASQAARLCECALSGDRSDALARLSKPGAAQARGRPHHRRRQLGSRARDGDGPRRSRDMDLGPGRRTRAVPAGGILRTQSVRAPAASRRLPPAVDARDTARPESATEDVGKPAPLIRVKPKDLAAAGIKRAPRVVGVRDGRPLLDDGRVLDVANVIWCSGFHPGFDWIDLPVFGDDGGLLHCGGVVENQPGLYFVGLTFLYAMSSSMIHGVGRDAARIVEAIKVRLGLRSLVK